MAERQQAFTYVMLISTKPKHKVQKEKSESLRLKIWVREFEVVQNTKYLGVQVHKSLEWKEYIKAVSSKVSRGIGFLKHVQPFPPEETLRTMYTGIVEQYFRFSLGLLWCC